MNHRDKWSGDWVAMETWVRRAYAHQDVDVEAGVGQPYMLEFFGGPGSSLRATGHKLVCAEWSANDAGKQARVYVREFLASVSPTRSEISVQLRAMRLDTTHSDAFGLSGAVPWDEYTPYSGTFAREEAEAKRVSAVPALPGATPDRDSVEDYYDKSDVERSFTHAPQGQVIDDTYVTRRLLDTMVGENRFLVNKVESFMYEIISVHREQVNGSRQEAQEYRQMVENMRQHYSELQTKQQDELRKLQMEAMQTNMKQLQEQRHAETAEARRLRDEAAREREQFMEEQRAWVEERTRLMDAREEARLAALTAETEAAEVVRAAEAAESESPADGFSQAVEMVMERVLGGEDGDGGGGGGGGGGEASTAEAESDIADESRRKQLAMTLRMLPADERLELLRSVAAADKQLAEALVVQLAPTVGVSAEPTEPTEPTKPAPDPEIVTLAAEPAKRVSKSKQE